MRGGGLNLDRPVHNVSVKMTETFAATIAVVAPVIWLVAVVEVHQYVKRLENLQILGTAAGRARRYAEQVEGPMTLEQASTLSRLLKEGGSSFNEKMGEAPAKAGVTIGYLFVVTILLTAEAFSLLWLGGPQKTNAWMAWFCLIAVLLAFFAVLVLPAVTAIGIAASVVSGRGGDLNWLADFARRQDSALHTEDQTDE
jgi:hypothetical protein